MACIDVQTEYLNKVFRKDRFREAFAVAVETIADFAANTPFDTIVFRGQSGAAFGYPLGLALDKHITCIRKRSENSHNPDTVEGFVRKGCKYIIVDDFSDTGATLGIILDEMDEAAPKSECVGVYLYSGNNIYADEYPRVQKLHLIKPVKVGRKVVR